MIKALIGYTGFVGSNIDDQEDFQFKFNSKNIDRIKGMSFDLLVCAGVRAQKWFANQNPEVDLGQIKELIDVLKCVKTKKFVLISTIDIYKSPNGVNESTKIDVEGLHPYGKNRLFLEKWVESNFNNYLIVRLPALFGNGLKKNFIYDIINGIPSVINKSKFKEIIGKLSANEENIINQSYFEDINGNFNFTDSITEEHKEELKNILMKIGFSSMQFTDYRSEFPFYFLDNLWNDIKIVINTDIKILNLAVEPIAACEIAEKCFNIKFENIIIDKAPVKYDMKTIYSDIYGKNGDYLYNKNEVIECIKCFMKREGVK